MKKPTEKVCTILIKDEVSCAVMGLSPAHQDILVDKYAMLVPSRFHMAKFKLGVWDGKIPYFKNAGETYVNLLTEIVPIVEDWDYKIKLVDKRQAHVLVAPEIDNTLLSSVLINGKPLILRDHQVDIINALLENGGGIGKAATGAGKTFITGALTLIHEALDDLRVLTIVPNKTLVKQTYNDYVMLGIDSGIYYGDEKRTDHKHLVSTWQSLINNPNMMRDYDVVIVDEVHLAKGKSLQDLLITHGRHIAYRFGVTGTMPKEDIDQMAVKCALGNIVVDVNAKNLIDKKLLSSLDITILELEHNLEREYEVYKKNFRKSLTRATVMSYKEFKDSYLPDYQAEKSYNAQNKEHMAWIAGQLDTWRHEHGNVLCLVDGVKHGEKIVDLIDDAHFLSGGDSVKKRTAIYDQYAKRDDMLTVATAQIASTGLNIKRIFTLVYINFGKSGIKVIQSIGRGLRMDDDKSSVKVFDITNDFKYSRRHTTERVKFYKEEQYPYIKKRVKFAPKSSDIFD